MVRTVCLTYSSHRSNKSSVVTGSAFRLLMFTGIIKYAWMNTICYTVWVRSRVDLVLFLNAESLLNDQLSSAKLWNDCLPCDN